MPALATELSSLSATTQDRRRVSVLGATGSVGLNTLDLISRNPDLYAVVALTANCNAKKLAQEAIAHGAEVAVVAEPARYQELKAALAGTGIEAAAGAQAVIEAAGRPADWVMAAIAGAAGLEPTLAAVRQGAHVALANKECLVSAGGVFMKAVKEAGTALLPVDSEHSAAFQAIDRSSEGIERIVLTASGGPFRSWSREQMAKATPANALKHPNWSMGPKITIDSATLMNKGLELIEAYHLFPVGIDQLAVIIHPQSIVHCLVEYTDGSVLAQLSCPDMRTPIAYSLAWPKRMRSPTERLDLVKLGALSFEPPDEARFPALKLARDALRAGGCAPAVLNAANEIAVEAFLAGRIGFLAIAELVEASLDAAGAGNGWREPCSLDEVLAIDAETRRLTQSLLSRFETISDRVETITKGQG